jgi:uncharacterized protein YndB with AHSA1/START domain
MLQAVRQRTVAAAPAEVFAVLADFGDIAEWARFIQHSCLLTEQAVGVGTSRRVQMPQQTLVETVTVWDEPRRLEYTIGGLPAIVGSVANAWTLTPTATGTTVELTTRIETGRPPHKRVIAKKVLERMTMASELMLTGLAELVEREKEART